MYIYLLKKRFFKLKKIALALFLFSISIYSQESTNKNAYVLFDNSFIPRLNNSQIKVADLNYTPKKAYYKQEYISDKNTRIPDYRTQLLWNPAINTTSSEITFYTSDVIGLFEIIIEGFTNEGKPLSIKELIEVK